MSGLDDQIDQTVREAAQRHLRAALKVFRLTETDDEHLSQTPENLVDFWLEFFEPYLNQAPMPILSTFPAAEMAGQFILIKNLPYHSLCAHHLTPFFGQAHIAYVPDRLGIGIGGPAKLLGYFSRRPQLQERLAAQIADAMMAAFSPRGTMVLVTARQLCMEMRGSRLEGLVEAGAARGCFEASGWQERFFSQTAGR